MPTTSPQTTPRGRASRRRPFVGRLVPLLALLLGAAGCGGGGEIAARPLERCGVLFVGTSLTAGYGLPADSAFPAILERSLAAAGVPLAVTARGVSGETTEGLEARLGGVLRESGETKAVVVVETGANDMLRRIAATTVRARLERIADTLAAAAPEALPVAVAVEPGGALRLIGVGANGVAIAEEWISIATERGWPTVPDLLDEVRLDPALNQADRIHPTAEGQRRLARTVAPALRAALAQQGCPAPPRGWRGGDAP